MAFARSAMQHIAILLANPPGYDWDAFVSLPSKLARPTLLAICFHLNINMFSFEHQNNSINGSPTQRIKDKTRIQAPLAATSGALLCSMLIQISSAHLSSLFFGLPNCCFVIVRHRSLQHLQIHIALQNRVLRACGVSPASLQHVRISDPLVSGSCLLQSPVFEHEGGFRLFHNVLHFPPSTQFYHA